MTPTTRVRGISPTIDRYLSELEVRAAHLPADERDEIVSSVEDHIADELEGSALPPSTSRVQEILAALGPVSAIIDAPAAAPAAEESSGTRLRAIGVLGSVLALVFVVVYPPLGFLLGLGMVVIGLVLRRRAGDKKFGTAVALLGAVAVLATVIWAVTSLSVGTQGTPGPTPVPAIPSGP